MVEGRWGEVLVEFFLEGDGEECLRKIIWK